MHEMFLVTSFGLLTLSPCLAGFKGEVKTSNQVFYSGIYDCPKQ